MNDVVKRLNEAKERTGLSYSDLARLTGIPKSTIQRYLTGYTGKLPLDVLQKITHALQIDARMAMMWDSPDTVTSPGGYDAFYQEPEPSDGFTMTDEEKLLLLKYRDSPKVIQEAIMRMLS